MSVLLGHGAPDLWLPDARNVHLPSYRQCRSRGVFKLLSASLEAYTLLAVIRSLTSKLSSADKEVREGSS